jgi:S1-C subfamily serine protease
MFKHTKKVFLLFLFIFIFFNVFAGDGTGQSKIFSTNIIEKVKQATVFIHLISINNSAIETNNGRGLCSGFIINDKGHIVTNYHCVHNTTELKLAFYDEDDWNLYEVKIIGIDPLSDLAIIHIPKRKKPLPYLNWETREVEDGTPVLAVGHPYGLTWTITTGIISHTERIIKSPYVRMLQSDTVLNSGNSGGPLVNIKGNVVGVNTLLYNPTGQKTYIGMSLSIRNDDAKTIADVLIEGKEFVRPIIGLMLYDLTPLNREIVIGLDDVKASGIDIPNTFGTIIIPQDSIPEGLEALDVIVAIDGIPVNRQKNIVDIVRLKSVGEKINLIVIRDKVFVNVEVVLKKLQITAAQLFDKTTPPSPDNNSTEKKNEDDLDGVK